MKIIVVYKSKTGFSEQYAKWIQTALNCDIIPLDQLKTLEGYDLVIYGAGLMAGKMNGLKDFKPYIQDQKTIIYATGAISKDATEIVDKIKNDNLSQFGRDVPFYYFEAGLDYDKLGFFSKKMLKMMYNSLKKKTDKTAEEIGMMEAIAHSHNYAKESDILPLIETVKQS
ncbi:MAG: flavodoxin domain-containing protein [Coprobacillus cateniformis]|uniref:flavodoxin domain-containing protein n=1 Tax=Coprobacillus cateniformis TaxID=100884 RepID=UPI0039A29624